MSMTPIETAIMDLSDAGLNEKEIVRRGFGSGTVRYALSAFGTISADEKHLARHSERMMKGSRKLQSAIKKARA